MPPPQPPDGWGGPGAPGPEMGGPPMDYAPERGGPERERPVARRSTPPVDAWLEQVRFRIECLDLLARGGKGEVAAVLQGNESVLDGAGIGPASALLLYERAPNWNIVDYLRARFKARAKSEEQRAVVAVARRVGSEAARTMLEEILLSQQNVPAERPDGEPPAGGAPPPQPQPQPPAGGAPGAPQPQLLKADVVQAVARALGSLGDYKTLRKALIYRAVGRRLEFAFSVEVRKAALDAMAYLPEDQDAVTLLRKLPDLPDADHKTGLEEAMIEAFRLRLKKAGGPAQGGGG